MAREPIRESRQSSRPRQPDLTVRDPHAPSLSIDEYAACTGVSSEAIRFYEQEGLIPVAVRAGSGRYRRREPHRPRASGADGRDVTTLRPDLEPKR